MAKLKDLVNVSVNKDIIIIQNVEIPIIFTMESFDFLIEAYGKTYTQFEKDMNKMLKSGTVTLSKDNLKLMRSLVYAMVRTGGTECTMEELEGAITQHEMPDVYKKALEIFAGQRFQAEDMKKIKSGKK
ncbi:hypothetical protein [Listeria booriae]|uniref:hypothetical protein n=1 Tax=Listeria booriae TaxID=1552123 RepID=UPI0016283835|nr:hypothetical protein [Listeria booriae]MBC1983008.1 hypothetical protein [Listeria booriae]MBC2196311.1 hypothetical protein [Listeria booriae]MBC6300300.1 hypothetical protein [Listeria booriae]